MINIKTLFTVNVLKRLLITLPLSILTSYFFQLNNIRFATLFSFIIDFLVYIFVDILLCNKDERRKRKEILFSTIDNYGFLAGESIILISISIYSYSLWVKPSNIIVSNLSNLIEQLGLIVVFMLPIISFLKNFKPHQSYLSFVRGLTAYFIAVALIDQFGYDVYYWIIKHPQSAALYAVTFVILREITRFGIIGFRDKSSADVAVLAHGNCKAFKNSVPTSRDYHYTAAHEAGHALIYAAMNPVPKNLIVVVNEHSDVNGTLGYVESKKYQHHLDDKIFAELMMLINLAGTMGESVIFNNVTLGSSQDYCTWLNMAQNYLSNQFCGVYYKYPKNDLEQSSNTRLIETLKIKQEKLLSEFFTLNHDLYKELYTKLLDKKRLDGIELFEFLDRAIFPAEFPRPSIEFD